MDDTDFFSYKYDDIELSPESKISVVGDSKVPMRKNSSMKGFSFMYEARLSNSEW